MPNIEMLRPCYRLIAAAGLALLASSTCMAQLNAFKAQYEVLRNGEPLGQATLALAPVDGSIWRLTTSTRGTSGLAALGGVKIDESSEFRWVDGKIELLNYSYKQKIAWSERDRSILVDPVTKKIQATNRDERAELPYREGILDRHLLTVALMQAMPGIKGQILNYPVVDRLKLETQTFRRSASVKLRTAIGIERAIRIERVRDSDDGKETKLWLARERNWLPLRILQRDGDGELIDMRILETGN